MTTSFHLTSLELDALKEIGNISAGNAATAFSQLVGHKVDMMVPEVKFLPIAKIEEGLEADALRIGFYQRVLGEAAGHILVTLTKDSAFELIHLMLNEPSGKPRFLTPRDEDFLKELANIVVGSYLTTLSKITGFLFMPSVPVMTIDLVRAIVNYILELNPVLQYAFILYHQLRVANTSISLQFILLPHPDSLPVILKAVHSPGK